MAVLLIVKADLHGFAGCVYDISIVPVYDGVIKGKALATDLTDPDLKNQASIDGDRPEIVTADMGQDEFETGNFLSGDAVKKIGDPLQNK